jgi:hypothetical protein
VTVNGADLRALVREVVRDAIGDVADLGQLAVAAPTTNGHNGLRPAGPLNAEEKTRVDTVRIATDADLDAFVRQLLRLFENPKSRADLRNGRLSFRLANQQTGGAQAATHRIDKGAVTERQIIDIAASGGALILGPKAVLTPLAREKARSLGVTINKERR